MKVQVLVLIALIFASGCVSSETRSYYLGVVPNPANSSWEDITSAYEEAGKIAEVTMVWTGTNIGQTEKLKQNQLITGLRVYGLKPILTLNFATIKEGESGLEYAIDAPPGINPDLSDPGFRDAWIGEARSLAREFKPEYLSLGNEVNDYFYLHPEDLDSYLTLFGEAYLAIKEVSPETKVFVVFSYTHLIDNGQWDFFEKFNKADIIVLTSYPWKHFDDPDEIDEDYYSRIKQYTGKPIAFTEIGWPDPEDEQARFLERFIELTRGLDLEMINWLFLHETKLSGVAASVTDPATGTIALKKADGSEKQIYDAWLKIKRIPYA
jgi:hypothetical protein